MNRESQKHIKVRLAKIEGQVRGLMNMIETDRESHAILTQLAALRAALDSVGSLVISDHIETLANSSGLGPDSRSALKSMIEIFLR